mmetsp:Transcript_60710/g.160658  ORF Transcript_60710/g.160658 Transcript_60710/m.160658 type:complete len:207 (-) Transcript_60710:621-1241(-)
MARPMALTSAPHKRPRAYTSTPHHPRTPHRASAGVRARAASPACEHLVWLRVQPAHEELKALRHRAAREPRRAQARREVGRDLLECRAEGRARERRGGVVEELELQVRRRLEPHQRARREGGAEHMGHRRVGRVKPAVEHSALRQGRAVLVAQTEARVPEQHHELCATRQDWGERTRHLAPHRRRAVHRRARARRARSLAASPQTR